MGIGIGRRLVRRRDVSDGLMDQTAALFDMRNEIDRIIARNQRLTMLTTHWEDQRDGREHTRETGVPTTEADTSMLAD